MRHDFENDASLLCDKSRLYISEIMKICMKLNNVYNLSDYYNRFPFGKRDKKIIPNLARVKYFYQFLRHEKLWKKRRHYSSIYNE